MLEDPDEEVNRGAQNRVEEAAVLERRVEGLAEKARDEAGGHMVRFVGLSVQSRSAAVRAKNHSSEAGPTGHVDIARRDPAASEVVVEKCVGCPGQRRC